MSALDALFPKASEATRIVARARGLFLREQAPQDDALRAFANRAPPAANAALPLALRLLKHRD